MSQRKPDRESAVQPEDSFSAVNAFHHESANRSVPVTLTQALARATDKHPEKTAFIYNDAHGRQVLSYCDLAMQATQLAAYLQSMGIRSGDRVGIVLPRSIEAPVAIFGVFLAGAVYVPVDVSLPVDAILHTLSDCDISVLITHPAYKKGIADTIDADNFPVTDIIGLQQSDVANDVRSISWSELAATTHKYSPVQNSPVDLAYIIFTSGSTGRPKGIIHTHRSAMAYVQLAVDSGILHSQSTVASHSPLHTDMSTLGLLAAPSVGATTVVLSEAEVRLPSSLANALLNESVTTLYCVPFALIQLIEAGSFNNRTFASLDYVVYAGEPLPPVYAGQLQMSLPDTVITNHYGPAETNVCTWFDLPQNQAVDDWLNEEDSIPIGKLWHPNKYLIVDENDQPVVRGEEGELLIHSPTMMQDYWNTEKHQSEYWYTDDSPEGTIRYYRTGDLVSETREHGLRLTGRKDRQVKLRGFRIELDQIEMVMSSMPAVKAAASFITSDANHRQHLNIAILPDDKQPLSEREVMMFATKSLPISAIPDAITILPALPRSTSGKIDRQQLIKLFSSEQLDNE